MIYLGITIIQIYQQVPKFLVKKNQNKIYPYLLILKVFISQMNINKYKKELMITLSKI